MKVIKKILIVLIIVIVAFVGVTIWIFYDSTDNTPNYIEEVKNIETKTLLKEKAEQSLKQIPYTAKFDYTFNEEEINKILATIVPTIDITSIDIKSIYIFIDKKENLHIQAPIKVVKIFKTCLKADCFLNYDNDAISLTIKNITLGKIKSKRLIFNQILGNVNLEEIANSLKNKGIYINIEKQNDEIKLSMTKEQLAFTIKDSIEDRIKGTLIAAGVYVGLLNNPLVDVKLNEDGVTGIVIDITKVF